MSRELAMVRMIVDVRTLSAFAANAGLIDDDLGYALHVAFRRLFGETGPQPLRVISETDREATTSTMTVLGYSTAPDRLAGHSAQKASTFSLPDWDGNWADASLDGLLREPIAVRPMPTNWQRGAHFDFEVLIRPVRRASAGTRERHASTGTRARSGERDAFLSALDTKSGEAVIDRESVYVGWLRERFADAASLDGTTTLARFRRTRVRRSRHAGGTTRLIEGPEALLKGRLVVHDPDKFYRLLERGIGRHVAFGYGMLLLKPVGGT